MRFSILIAALAVLAGCQTAADDLVVSNDPEPDGPLQTVPLEVDDVDDLAARLQGLGIEMTLESYSSSNARSISGATYALPDDDTLIIFEYGTQTARDADLEALAAESEPGGAASIYAAADRFAVVYSGTDADTRAALADLLDPVPAQ
jgi:hypothetical protein